VEKEQERTEFISVLRERMTSMDVLCGIVGVICNFVFVVSCFVVLHTAIHVRLRNIRNTVVCWWQMDVLCGIVGITCSFVFVVSSFVVL
jgi:hypothetical protein